MTDVDRSASLDDRIARYLAAEAEVVAAAARPADDVIALIGGRVDGRHQDRTGRTRLVHGWAWAAVLLIALLALVAGSVILGGRPRLPVSVIVPPGPTPSTSPALLTAFPTPTPSAVATEEAFSLGVPGSLILARTDGDGIVFVSVDPSGGERTLGALEHLESRLGDWRMLADASQTSGCWRFCTTPMVRISSRGRVVLPVTSARDSGPANLVLDLRAPTAPLIAIPPGWPMFEPDGTLVIETGDGDTASSQILLYAAPEQAPREIRLPAGVAPAFNQYAPIGYALAADGTGIFATRPKGEGLDYLIARWDGSTIPATGAAPMFVTGAERILGMNGESEPFSGLWDKAGDASCGPTGTQVVSTSAAFVYCAGPDSKPSTVHPAEPTIDAPVGALVGIVGFTDSAVLVDIDRDASHVTEVVPLDGSATTDYPGWLVAVVQ